MIARALGSWAGGLPRTFWLLWGGTLLNRVGTFVEPFLALYLTAGRHLSVAGAGAIVAVVGGGSILSQPLGGALADRVGRRPTLMGGLLASALAISFMALARSIWLLVAAAAVVGLASDIYRPAAQATIADVVPMTDRRRASGLLFWAVNLGFSVAAIGGGLLAAGGYGLLFAIDALTCMAYAVVVWRTIPETRPTAAAHEDAPGWSTVLRDRVAMAFFGLNLGVATVYATTFTILPLAMRADGHSPATYGAVVAVNGILIVLLHPIVSSTLLRMRPATVLAVGALLSAVAMGVIARSDGIAGYLVAITFITLGEICNASIGPGVVAEIGPPAVRGRYSGAYGLSWGLAFTLAPLVGAPLLGEAGDAATPWVAASALSLVVAGGMLTLGPALEARRRRAAAYA
ncbi:MAG TPA: MFS transporter [Baekduia sp.]|uniref:MFS transporter n=1 Tax=Baekduia sp. TaxID=2600305 RepID=UPI002C2E8CB8|nr:MFS transporter [Baekduia sp.]HMJ34684.1 MFS transporter [Baekduia sp.]